MGLGYTRSDLRANAQAKLDDALLLWQNGRYSNAYYLAGYAVEIALKACVAAQIVAETIPDKELIRKIFNHEFNVLVGLAGLSAELKENQDKDSEFATNWAVASRWSPDIRDEVVDQTSAQVFIDAIADARSGVLQWIRAHW